MGDLTKDIITRRTTKQVLDRAEAIQIDQTDGKWRRIKRPLSHQFCYLFTQAYAIAQTGEPVGVNDRVILES